MMKLKSSSSLDVVDLTPSPREMMAEPQDLVVSEGDSAFFQCIVGGRFALLP